MTARLFLDRAGFVAPGLDDADALRAHLGGAAYVRPEGWMPGPKTLPPRQARRLSIASRLAIAAAEQIAPALPLDAAWIFASATGEGMILNEILTALSQPEILIRPVSFQNAVHNAAQGQWSIAAGARGPMTSIAAYDETAGAALLKAVLQITAEDTPTGVVVFDAPLPEPLHPKRPFAMPMAAALALAPRRTDQTLAELAITHVAQSRLTDPAGSGADPALTGSNNPARFLIPLLGALWQASLEPVVLGLGGGSALSIETGR